MSDTTIPDLPVLIGLSGLEQIWGNLNGVDFRFSSQQIANLVGPGAFGFNVVQATASTFMTPGVAYGVRTDLGAFTMVCPALIRPTLIIVQDTAANAAANNITINGNGLDVSVFGTSAPTQPINISGAGLILWGFPGYQWSGIPVGY